MLAFEVLPGLLRDVRSEGLHGALGSHLEETKEHAVRLEQVFRAAGAEPSSNLSPPFEKLAEHHGELAGNVPDEALADVLHAAAAAATEHQELALYEALLALAHVLDLGEAVELLERNRDEEARALATLQGELGRLAGALSA